MYKKTILSNGLRVITHDMKERDSVSLGFWIGVGGRYESDAIKGAAHFLEHILFKGSKKYSCEKIKQEVEGVGGALNAFTSEEQTCYYAKTPANHLNQTFDVLADMVIHPKIMPNDVAKERTVIIEEIKMYHDLPQYFVLELLDELIWPNHPLGKNLAGTEATVSAMTSDHLKDFHQTYYGPENMVVAACGKLSHDTIAKLTKRAFGQLKTRAKHAYLPAQGVQSQPRFHLFKKEIEQMHIALGMQGYDERHKDRYVLSLLSIILGGNMSSRLFVELREKRGLAYSISSSSKSLHDTGVFVIRGGVDNKNLVLAVDLILKELNKIKTQGIPHGEFERGREYILGQLLLGLEDTMDHMLWIGESLIAKDEMKNLKAMIAEFQKIKRDDIKRVAKDILDMRRMNLAIVGPLEDKQEMELKKIWGA